MAPAAQTPPGVQSFAVMGQGLTLNATVQPSAIYRLQFSTNLITWDLETNFVAAGSTFQFLAPKPTNAQRFYRLISP
jgi:hypothetical protein